MPRTDQYEYILVRYGELSTKGRNKKDFIRQLTRNVKAALKEYRELEYRSDRDRLYIYLNGTDPEGPQEKLKRVFGIRSFSLAMKVEPDIGRIREAGLEAAREEERRGAKTFKVKARRNDKKFPLVSDQINRECAGVILSNTGLKVDVHHPDFPLIVEVHKDAAYIMARTIYGAGGYPVRIGGWGMLLLSGGIDSPVAGEQMMKRGVALQAIHFQSRPYTSEEAVQKVYQLADVLSGCQGSIKVHVVPFTELQLAIYDHCPESYAVTIMRRMMLRIAQKKAEQEKCTALVTGESIGQVASQTLESIAAINEVASMPVIRPLATWDKLEIIEEARRLGTYETSILPYEDCCTIFTPKNPVTKPKASRCREYEAKFAWQPLVDKAVEGIQTVILPKREEAGGQQDGI